MVKYKIGIRFDKHLLKTLTENINSGVKLQKVYHHLALHPIHLNDFNKSVKDLLSQEITKYNRNLDGILLGYQNVKLPRDIGLINNDSCYIHVDLQADFFVFKPEIGKEMQGVVNRKSKDHVGILVYGAFNVSIPKLDTDENWLGNTVNIGYEVLFKITFINLSSYLPYFRGELISVISEVDGINSPKKGKKIRNGPKPLNKKIIFDDEPTDDEIASINEPKKFKRHTEKSPKHLHENKKKKVCNNEEEYFSDMYCSKKENNKLQNKLKRKNNVDDVNISELSQKTKTSLSPDRSKILENIKSELDSGDENAQNLKLNKTKHHRKLNKINNKNEDELSTVKEKKLKMKNKNLKKGEYSDTSNEDLNLSKLFNNSQLESENSLENIKLENTNPELDNPEVNLKHKKSKKRKHSFSDSEVPTKERKRKSS